MTYAKKPCEKCGNDFTPKSIQQLYCTDCHNHKEVKTMSGKAKPKAKKKSVKKSVQKPKVEKKVKGKEVTKKEQVLVLMAKGKTNVEIMEVVSLNKFYLRTLRWNFNKSKK